MSAETGADLAHYDRSSVAGRLRPGLICSGDIYSLESWQEPVEPVEVRGSNLSAVLLAKLRERGIMPDSEKTYLVATTTHVANELNEKLGRIESRCPGAASALPRDYFRWSLDSRKRVYMAAVRELFAVFASTVCGFPRSWDYLIEMLSTR